MTKEKKRSYHSRMVAFLKIILALLLLTIILALGYGFYRTWKTGWSEDYDRFQQGMVPSVMPEGLWKGTALGLGEVSWKGKKFFKSGTGINLVGEEEKFPFRFSKEMSIKDGKKEVIRLDYNQPENPFWLRFIVDEMVSTGENQFLGIVYIKVIPWLPFRMGYFTLTK